MSKRFTLGFQILAMFLQFMSPAFFASFPHLKPYESLVSAFIAFLQGVQALSAHYYNPDGTSAKSAYDPKAN